MMLKKAIGLTLLLFTGLAPEQTRAQSCPPDEGPPEGAILFLEAAKSDTSVPDECVERALHQLYHLKTPAAIEVLTRYLDFERPLTVAEKNGVIYHPMEMYPAVDELFAMGRSALPALSEVLGSAEDSNLTRQNALRTVMAIYRGDEPAGVAFLAALADAATSVTKSRLFHEASYDAVALCSPTVRTKCQVAAENHTDNEQGK